MKRTALNIPTISADFFGTPFILTYFCVAVLTMLGPGRDSKKICILVRLPPLSISADTLQ